MNLDRLNSVAWTVSNLWNFFKAGCPADIKLFCKCQAKEILAREMFMRARNYIFVHPDSLPWDADIKAMGINFAHNKTGGRLYIEFTLVDWNLAQEKLAEAKNQYDNGLEIKGRGFFWHGKKVLTSVSRHHFGKVTSPRTVLYTIDDLRDTPVEPLAYVADLLYSGNCFSEVGAPQLQVGNSVFTTPQLKTRRIMVQTQEMRQIMATLITQEQKPMMIMTLRQQAKLFHSQHILKMNIQELEDHVRLQMHDNACLQRK